MPDPRVEDTREQILLSGDLPSPANPPTGCRFHDRCPYAWERCLKEHPPLYALADGHVSRCHLADEPERRAHRHLPLAAQQPA